MLASMLLPPINNASIIYALVWIINNNYGRYSSSPLTIGQFSKSVESRDYHNELIDAMLLEVMLSRANVGKYLLENELRASEQPENSTSKVRISRDGALFFVDSMRSYMRLERHLLKATNLFNRSGFLCIVYTGKERGRLDTIKVIFRRVFAVYMINVNVVLVIRGQVQAYTYFPFQPNKCQSSMPIYHTSLQEARQGSNFRLDKKFFPKKVVNLQGCKLVAVTFSHPPYVILEKNLIDGELRMHGIEGMIVNTLASLMNFTIRITIQEDKDRGIVYENGTATGATKKVIEGTANFTFVSYMYSKERAQYMTPSLTYTSFRIILCLPSGHSLSPFMRLLRPFRYIIWSCLSSSIALGFLMIGTLRLYARIRTRHFVFGARNAMPCFNLWSTLFAGMVSFPPRRNFARYLLVVWLLYTMVMRTAYSGELFILLQDGSVRTPLQTLDEVQSKNYIFHMLPALVSVFRAIMPNIRIQVILNGNNGMRQGVLRLRDDSNANIVMPLLEPTVQQYNMETHGQKRLTVLPEPLMTAPMTIFMRKHSYLQRQFDEFLMAMMSSGLVQRYRRIYMVELTQSAMSTAVDEPLALTIWRLGGVFCIFAVMQLLACLVFMVELLTERSVRLRKFVNIANRFIA